MEKTLAHYGTKRHSGRYPWGSGGENVTRAEKLKAKGLSETEIAKALGIKTPELRNQLAIAKAEQKEAERLHVIREKERGKSIAAISRESGIAESTIRDLLKPNANLKWKIITGIADALKSAIEKTGLVDVGKGTEIFLEVPKPKLDNAVQLLKNEGYEMHYLQVPQLGTSGNKMTSIKALSKPGMTYNEARAVGSDISIPNFHADIKGENFLIPGKPKNLDSSKVLVKYENTGGAEKDGLIELRRDIPEFSLNGKNYAQVRIGIDGTHYLKGMAVLRDDLPDGVDIVYNTSKIDTGNKHDAMKVQEATPGKPSRFGTVVKPNRYTDKNGKEVEGPINIVGSDPLSVEGAWSEWDNNLASQVLSKQSPRITKKQLDIKRKNMETELNDINSLTNPTVRKHLLEEFADKVDRAVVDLKAAALPRQTTNVLLPDPKMDPQHIYAPNYKNGEVVSLIRYPHGGVFEIPTLRVNNKYSEYRNIIGKTAKDAVAVHPDVAHKLSGADFDGDTVLVVPNSKKEIRTAPSLEGLKNFDPQSYKIPKGKIYDEKTNPTGIKVMTEKQKQMEMGKVSNLITDMTIKGAPEAEIARAVRHSMVVIDGAKHELNYKQSYRDNAIAALKEKYQGGAARGAATLISRASAQERVPQRFDHYSIDPVTGEKLYTHTDKSWVNKKTGEKHAFTTRSTKLAEEADAYNLSSGTLIEGVYAKHANRLKSLANQARLDSLKTEATPYNRQARKTYLKEVKSLEAKYKAALRHKPVERKKQLLGNEIYRARKENNPDMSYADKKKAKGQSLVLAGRRIDARKPVISITPREWEAIEMGAVSKTRLKGILRNSDMDRVRELATPRTTRSGLSTGKKSRALTLLKSGYTNAQVAAALGVPVHQVRDIDKG